MSKSWKRLHHPLIDRRGFMKGAAALGGVGAAAAIFTSHAGAQGESIVVWDYKNPPGSDGNKYYLAAAERFKAQSGISVAVEFKSAESIEQAVAAAANAGEGFDSLVWWSGPTARNQASLGNVIPLDDKIPPEDLQAKAGLAATTWQGRVYAIPRTIGTYFLVYNRTLLDKAGVDSGVFPPANADPVKWDVFLDVCEKVRSGGGVAPLMFANKEGYFNEWYFYNFLGMGFDSSDEIAEIGSGRSTWKNENVYRALEAYKQLYDRKFFVEGGEVVAYEQHVRQMGGGQCAMSVYFDPTGGATNAIVESFGKEAVGFTRVPAYREDKKLYGHSSLEPDAVYVASFSEKQDAAVKWVNFLASLPEVNEMVKALQLAPADSRFDPSLIVDKQLAELFQGAAAKGHVYPYTFVTQPQYNALLQNGILYLTGRMTAEELCETFDAADKEYLAQQPQ
jgi:ABC-type glycerol-3-phosphate transport system substrate-binding protein